MPDPRGYSKATIFALASLGGQTCYWPDPPCQTTVVVIINGQPVRNVEIAHIRAANRNGPRYSPDMTDDDRRQWSNLILLCTPHHNVVDKIRPNDYPIQILERWKSQREKHSARALNMLGSISEDRFQELISGAIRQTADEITAAISRLEFVDPDAAELLHYAADRLSPAMDADNVELLWNAANTLQQIEFADAVDLLIGIMPRLEQTIQRLREAQDEM